MMSCWLCFSFIRVSETGANHTVYQCGHPNTCRNRHAPNHIVRLFVRLLLFAVHHNENRLSSIACLPSTRLAAQASISGMMNQGATAPTQGVFSSAWVRVWYSSDIAYTMVPVRVLRRHIVLLLLCQTHFAPRMTTTISTANAVSACVLCEVVTVGDAPYRQGWPDGVWKCTHCTSMLPSCRHATIDANVPSRGRRKDVCYNYHINVIIMLFGVEHGKTCKIISFFFRSAPSMLFSPPSCLATQSAQLDRYVGI